MKLILLFGPPAVGKLTVAKELVSLTGFTLFHNHVILNAVSDIFGYDSEARRKLEKEFRKRILEEAIGLKMNLIMTGVIVHENISFYKNVIQMVESSGGEILAVKLTAPKEIILERVPGESRKQMNKIATEDAWHDFINTYPGAFDTLIPNEHITIDTSGLSAKEVAEKIVKEYSL